MPLAGFCVGSFGAFKSIGRSSGIVPWCKPDARLSWNGLAAKVAKTKIAGTCQVELHMIGNPFGVTAALKLTDGTVLKSVDCISESEAIAVLSELDRLQDDIVEASL